MVHCLHTIYGHCLHTIYGHCLHTIYGHSNHLYEEVLLKKYMIDRMAALNIWDRFSCLLLIGVMLRLLH